MGKASGVSRRRKKIASHRYSSSKKLKRVRRAQLKKSGGIQCEPIRQAWDDKKSLRKNLKHMGLSHDPNKLLRDEERERAERELRQLKGVEVTLSTTERLHQQLLRQKQRNEAKKKRKQAQQEQEQQQQNTIDDCDQQPKLVADQLAEEAARPVAKNFRFGPDNVKFCAYMIEKYGDDYEAMSRDRTNHYQESAGQIRAKIRKFLAIPEHQRVYKLAKEMIEAKCV